MALDPHSYDIIPIPHRIGDQFDNQLLIRLEGRVEMWQTNTSYIVWLHDFQKYLLWARRATREDADELFERVLVIT